MSKAHWFAICNIIFASLPLAVLGIDLSRLYGHMAPISKRSGAKAHGATFDAGAALIERKAHRGGNVLIGCMTFATMQLARKPFARMDRFPENYLPECTIRQKTIPQKGHPSENDVFINTN